jgi:hypothetical protein
MKHQNLKKNNLTDNKSLVLLFYKKLLKDDFVSTKDLVVLFGNTYNEADFFLKRKNNVNDCNEISASCQSYIFSIMKKKSNQVCFNLSFQYIKKIIESSNEMSRNKLDLSFFNNKVSFFIEGKIISNIIINNSKSFFEEFEE